MVGPSGVGKETLRKAILNKYGELFEGKISYTTRNPKQFEKNKGNYHFISKEEFMRVSINNRIILCRKQEITSLQSIRKSADLFMAQHLRSSRESRPKARFHLQRLMFKVQSRSMRELLRVTSFSSILHHLRNSVIVWVPVQKPKNSLSYVSKMLLVRLSQPTTLYFSLIDS